MTTGAIASKYGSSIGYVIEGDERYFVLPALERLIVRLRFRTIFCGDKSLFIAAIVSRLSNTDVQRDCISYRA